MFGLFGGFIGSLFGRKQNPVASDTAIRYRDHTEDNGPEGQVRTLLELRKFSSNAPELSPADIQILRKLLEWLTTQLDISSLPGQDVETRLLAVLSDKNFVPSRSGLAYELRLSHAIACLTKARPDMPAPQDFARKAVE